MRSVYGWMTFLALGTLAPGLVAQAQRSPEKVKDERAERREERRDERRADEKKADERKAVEPRADIVHGNADEQLAAVILAACHNEVELGKFAQSMVKSAEAKQFAERIVKDHQAACEKLEKLAGKYHGGAGVPKLEPKAKIEFGRLKLEASGAVIKAKAEGEPAHSAVILDWVRIQQELANECLASAKAELQRNDKQVDECFIGMQIAAHMKMVDQLKVFQKYASPTFRNQIDAALETAQAHLKEAKAIMQTQAKANTAAASQ